MKNVLKSLFFVVCFFSVMGVAQAQTIHNNTTKTDTIKKEFDINAFSKDAQKGAEKSEGRR